MKINTILKPDVRVLYLRNSISEKVTYLKVPNDIGLRSLEKDINNGAVQFKEIREYVDKKDSSNYVMINTNNKEMGFIAIMYLEACRKYDKEKMLFEDDDCEESGTETIDYDVFEKMDDDDFYEECIYEESEWRIPIISMSDIKRNLSDGSDKFTMNNLPMQGGWNTMNHKPYWTNCTRKAVCIMHDSIDYWGFGSSGGESEIEALSYFGNNERVYILNVEHQNEYEPDSFEDDVFASELSMGDIVKNQIVLEFIAEELDVELPEEKKRKYYKKILRCYFEKNNIKVKKGFSYDKILNLIFAMKTLDICQMIEKIVNYSIKDKKNEDEILLSNEDFKFIDRFARTERGLKKANCTNAKKRLMEELIGMDSVKEKVLDTVNIMKFNQIRRNMNIGGDSYHNVHVMLGAPGTAKTTVAELMGQIMVEEKLLPDNRFICVNGAELKGMYVGHSAPKTKALFENHDVIVIDEAYSLVDDRGENDSFSKEAIAQLIIELEKHATDKLVIFAGYGGGKVSEKNNKMRAFIDSNPGIKSRINSTFYFESYTAEEMVQIFYQIAKNQNFIVGPEAKDILKECFSTRVSDENFGNGREARSLLENSVVYMAKRVLAENKRKYSDKEMKQITVDDIRTAICQTKRANQVQNARNVTKIGF